MMMSVLVDQPISPSPVSQEKQDQDDKLKNCAHHHHGHLAALSQNHCPELPFQQKEQWEKLYRVYLIKLQTQTFSFDQFLEAFQILLSQLHIKQNLNVLSLFYDGLSAEEKLFFIQQFLPKLTARALELETIFKAAPAVMLKQFENAASTFTKRQISCVLANMFFGTIDYSRYRSLVQWYDGPYRLETKIEKIKCLYNYFKRIISATEMQLNLNVIIKRLQYLKQNNFIVPPTLNSSIKIFNDKPIEDFQQPEQIHIDFANQCIGGGVLDTGRVQEEIMFVTCPELLISCQICECIEDEEAIMIIGAERYSAYTGYSQTFAFKEDFVDQRKIDIANNCKATVIVAIDALFFHEHILSLQYQPKMIFRELMKALTGFQVTTYTPKEYKIVTGNWGCGSFHGDVQLKFLIQWIACSMQNRDMIYCTFGNDRLNDINKIINLLKGQSTDNIIKAIKNFKESSDKMTMFEYMMKIFTTQRTQ